MNSLIDMNEIGPCSTRLCRNRGKRARGSRDIEGLATRVNARTQQSRGRDVFRWSFYCDGCVAAAGQRSLTQGRSLAQSIAITEG